MASVIFKSVVVVLVEVVGFDGVVIADKDTVEGLEGEIEGVFSWWVLVVCFCSRF
jgi:hypothetical protein